MPNIHTQHAPQHRELLAALPRRNSIEAAKMNELSHGAISMHPVPYNDYHVPRDQVHILNAELRAKTRPGLELLLSGLLLRNLVKVTMHNMDTYLYI